MTDLHALIERLEQATEEQPCDPDWLREVRTAIADVCFDRAKPEAFSEPHWWAQGFIGWQALDDLPDWLFSIDAAKTLIPSNHDWLRKPGTMTVYRIPATDKEWAQHITAKGWNDASSLVIACLKARARLLPTEATHG